MRKNSQTVRIFIRLMLIPIIAACGLFAAGCEASKGKPFAEKAVEEFHTQLNAQQYSQIYGNLAEDFRKSVDEKQVESVLSTIHQKLGAFKSNKQTGFNVGSTNGVSAIKLDYEAEFAEGKATESFTFKVEGEKVSMMAFNIESDVLKK